MESDRNPMNRTLRIVALFAGGAVLLSCGILVLNQTAQVVELAEKIHPTLGTVILYSLLGGYIVALGVPIVLISRLPGPLVPPAEDEGPQFDRHLKLLKERLAANPHLAG